MFHGRLDIENVFRLYGQPIRDVGLPGRVSRSRLQVKQRYSPDGPLIELISIRR